MIVHRAHPAFWTALEALPEDVQRLAHRSYATMANDPFHPSLRLKAVGRYWSARVGLHYRALAYRVGDEFTWFWIGLHHAYDRLIR